MNNPQDSSKLQAKINELESQVARLDDLLERSRLEYAMLWLRKDMQGVDRGNYPDPKYIPRYEFVEVEGHDEPKMRIVIDDKVTDYEYAWDALHLIEDQIESNPENAEVWERVFCALIEDPMFLQRDRHSVVYGSYSVGNKLRSEVYCNHYGVTEADLHKIIGTWEHGMWCRKCGTEYEVQLTTRAETRAADYYGVCEACSKRTGTRETDLSWWDETNPEHRRAMPYKLYLQTDHWKQTREHALARAGHRCQLCNGNERLEVHHRTYERRGAEHLTDLTVLCAKCHTKFHEE